MDRGNIANFPVMGAVESHHKIGIVGPTASGKTAVAVALARRLPGSAEIVSVDSMQIFRHMEIGTAKPTSDEQRQAIFRGIDLVDPDEEFTLADYQNYASAEIARIRADGNTAILAGGTGLYFRAITTRLDIPITPPDADLRNRWTEFAAAKGNSALHRELRRIDEVSGNRIHVNDVRRIIRGLEVFEKTGRSLSDWHLANRSHQLAERDPSCYFCLGLERETLNNRINQRVKTMMSQGLLEEVQALRAMGYDASLHSMRSIGYRQMNEYCDGLVTIDQAVEGIQLESRQFARRQLIWFRGDKRLRWIQADNLDVHEIVDRICTSVNDESMDLTGEPHSE